MIMFKRLDRYILRHFFLSLFVVVMALGFTIIVINMVEELRDFIDHRVPFMQIVEYYVVLCGMGNQVILPALCDAGHVVLGIDPGTSQ